jgi:hypothetical protein
MANRKQREALKEFEQYWYKQWATTYSRLNGAFQNVGKVFDVEGLMLVVATMGRDADCEEGERWRVDNVFRISEGGTIYFYDSQTSLDMSKGWSI